MFTDAPEFRLWIQHDSRSEPPFALRWQVIGGRGTLFLPRGGGTDAAPATPSGTRSQLDIEDLQATRFVVVSDRSGARHPFELGPFTSDALTALDADTWTALVADQGGTALRLPSSPQESDTLRADPPGEKSTKIEELERALHTSQQRVAALTRRVAELEGQLDAARDPVAG